MKMKMLSKKLQSVAAACAATLWCTTPVWGDDTEIFFGDIDSAQARPNVLFIIDTSGSMSGTVTGTGKDRLDNVKDAMYTLLDELNNVNIGLMRFTNPGGPVLYPVKYIDADVNAGSIVTVETAIARGSDDAQELVDTGQMTLDGERLEIADVTSTGLDTFDDQVSGGADDAEEYISNGDSWNYSSVLDMDSNRRIGVRFTGSSVPDGATITNAYLRFTGVSSGNATPLKVRIFGQGDDTTSFQGNTNELRDRADTSAYVDWNITTPVAGDQTIDTPNIAAIVQEIVDDPDWDPAGGGEDDMVLILEAHPDEVGSGARDFYARDGSSSRAPQLFVEYYVGSAPATGLSRTGLRFDVTDIPRGVDITEAYISFTAERDFTSTYDLTIAVEDSGDTTTFTSSAGNINARTTSASTVAWAGTLSQSSGDVFQSPDLTTLVESVTDRNDWCGGNALSFIIEGTQGQLPVWAFEGSASLAPRLVVKYEYDSIPQGSSCIRRTVNRSISASSDDAEETGSSATTTSGDLDFYDGSDVGLRFDDLPIPNGASIFDARIQLVADANDGGTTNMTIYAENVDDAQTYSSTNGTIEDRTYLGSTVTWSESTSWSTNDVIDSPDVSSLVAAVVARSGWEPGNAIAFRIDTSTSTDREAESLDGSPGEAPRLIVEYEDDGSGFTSRRVREVVADLVDQLNHNGWTPIQDVLYEAARYYTGQSVLYGATRGDSSIDGGPFSYARISAAESMIDGTYSINRPAGCSEANLDDSDCRYESITGVGGSPMYESPIDDFCQEQSHIILLTDGEANRPHSTSLIPEFMGEACANEPTDNGDGTTTDLTSGEVCVKDLARYMNENDMRPTLTGNQRITTHTIGFNFSSQWLEDVATAGGGVYKTANNAAELVDEIKDIIGEVLKTDSTFVAPVAAVNQFNQLSHLAQVYFAVFRPDEFPRWRGNLKKYTLSDEGRRHRGRRWEPGDRPLDGLFHRHLAQLLERQRRRLEGGPRRGGGESAVLHLAQRVHLLQRLGEHQSRQQRQCAGEHEHVSDAGDV
jgi:type IV pilus assembly protein PilY1